MWIFVGHDGAVDLYKAPHPVNPSAVAAESVGVPKTVLCYQKIVCRLRATVQKHRVCPAFLQSDITNLEVRWYAIEPIDPTVR